MSLEVSGVSVCHDARYLLREVSLSLHPGEVLVVVGPNGAGKSTLLSLLAGDRQPDFGKVSLSGQPLERISLEALASLRAVVGSPPQLAFNFTVTDVIAMAWLHGDHYGAATRVEALIEALKLGDLLELNDRTYVTLSSGERQRVEFARACLQVWRPATDAAPRWLLLDEPTANLDVAHAVLLLESVRKRADAGYGVFAVLHDLDLAARFADRIALINHGELAALGSVPEVLTSERLSEVYGTPIHVEQHAQLKRTVVIG